MTTRHALSLPSDGIIFKAKFDDEVISLKRTQRPVGTRMRITVPDRLKERVKRIVPGLWQDVIHYGDPVGHYFLKRPSLKREFSNGRNPPVRGWLPDADDDVSEIWRCFKTAEFEKVFWTYNNDYPHLSSNGIVIQAMPRGYSFGSTLNTLISTPRVAVFDRNGLLPINLQRTELQGDLPFKESFLRAFQKTFSLMR